MCRRKEVSKAKVTMVLTEKEVQTITSKLEAGSGCWALGVEVMCSVLGCVCVF